MKRLKYLKYFALWAMLMIPAYFIGNHMSMVGALSVGLVLGMIGGCAGFIWYYNDMS